MTPEIPNIPPAPFPPCRHAGKNHPLADKAAWLANEPCRLFFLSGALFSIAGVLMWPAFFRSGIGAYPGIAHAKLMISHYEYAAIFWALAAGGWLIWHGRRFFKAE